MKKFNLFLLIYLFVSFQAKSQEWVNFTSTSSISTFFTKNDILYLGSHGGLVSYNTVTGYFDYKNRGNTNLPVNNIRDFLIDVNDNHWFINTLAGITKWDGNSWTNYTTSNSDIPSDNILSFSSDNLGNLWILPVDMPQFTRFDGVSWESVDVSSLSTSTVSIYKILPDNLGNLWFFGNNIGLVKFDGTNFTQFLPDNSGLPSNKISNIQFDSSGTLWISTSDAGLVSFNNTDFVSYNTSNTSLESNYISSFVIDENTIWGICSTTKNKFFKFDGANFESITILNDEFINGRIELMAATSPSKIWFMDTNGPKNILNSFDGNTSELTEIDYSATSLIGNIIPSIEIGTNGVVWIADLNNTFGRGGLVSYNHPSWNKYGFEQQVRWVKPINDSTTWFSSTLGLGRKTNDLIEYFTPSNSPLSSFIVHQMEYDFNNDIAWFGTESGLLKYSSNGWEVIDVTNSTMPPSLFANDFVIDSLGDLWFVSNELQSLVKFSNNDFQVMTSQNSPVIPYNTKLIEIDREGYIWLGTYDYGLLKIEGSNIYNIIPDVPGDQNNHIIALGFDNANDLWVSTPSGAICYKNNTWTLYNSTNSSIANNYILCFAFDSFNNVWMGTNSGGISVFNPSEVVLSNPIIDGLQSERFKIYPVPFSDFIKISKSDLNDNAHLFLYDMTGNLILSCTLDSNSNTLNTSTISNGSYIYRILQTDKNVQTGLIIKI